MDDVRFLAVVLLTFVQSIFALSGYLSESRSLVLLDIRQNSIDLAGIMALTKTMTINESLTSLLSDARNPLVPVASKDADLMQTFIAELDNCLRRNRHSALQQKSKLPSDEEVQPPSTNSDSLVHINEAPALSDPTDGTNHLSGTEDHNSSEAEKSGLVEDIPISTDPPQYQSQSPVAPSLSLQPPDQLVKRREGEEEGEIESEQTNPPPAPYTKAKVRRISEVFTEDEDEDNSPPQLLGEEEAPAISQACDQEIPSVQTDVRPDATAPTDLAPVPGSLVVDEIRDLETPPAVSSEGNESPAVLQETATADAPDSPRSPQRAPPFFPSLTPKLITLPDTGSDTTTAEVLTGEASNVPNASFTSCKKPADSQDHPSSEVYPDVLTGTNKLSDAFKPVDNRQTSAGDSEPVHPVCVDTESSAGLPDGHVGSDSALCGTYNVIEPVYSADQLAASVPVLDVENVSLTTIDPSGLDSPTPSAEQLAASVPVLDVENCSLPTIDSSGADDLANPFAHQLAASVPILDVENCSLSTIDPSGVDSPNKSSADHLAASVPVLDVENCSVPTIDSSGADDLSNPFAHQLAASVPVLDVEKCSLPTIDPSGAGSLTNPSVHQLAASVPVLVVENCSLPTINPCGLERPTSSAEQLAASVPVLDVENTRPLPTVDPGRVESPTNPITKDANIQQQADGSETAPLVSVALDSPGSEPSPSNRASDGWDHMAAATTVDGAFHYGGLRDNPMHSLSPDSFVQNPTQEVDLALNLETPPGDFQASTSLVESHEEDVFDKLEQLSTEIDAPTRTQVTGESDEKTHEVGNPDPSDVSEFGGLAAGDNEKRELKLDQRISCSLVEALAASSRTEAVVNLDEDQLGDQSVRNEAQTSLTPPDEQYAPLGLVTKPEPDIQEASKLPWTPISPDTEYQEEDEQSIEEKVRESLVSAVGSSHCPDVNTQSARIDEPSLTSALTSETTVSDLSVEDLLNRTAADSDPIEEASLRPLHAAGSVITDSLPDRPTQTPNDAYGSLPRLSNTIEHKGYPVEHCPPTTLASDTAIEMSAEPSHLANQNGSNNVLGGLTEEFLNLDPCPPQSGEAVGEPLMKTHEISQLKKSQEDLGIAATDYLLAEEERSQQLPCTPDASTLTTGSVEVDHPPLSGGEPLMNTREISQLKKSQEDLGVAAPDHLLAEERNQQLSCTPDASTHTTVSSEVDHPPDKGREPLMNTHEISQLKKSQEDLGIAAPDYLLAEEEVSRQFPCPPHASTLPTVSSEVGHPPDKGENSAPETTQSPFAETAFAPSEPSAEVCMISQPDSSQQPTELVEVLRSADNRDPDLGTSIPPQFSPKHNGTSVSNVEELSFFPPSLHGDAKPSNEIASPTPVVNPHPQDSWDDEGWSDFESEEPQPSAKFEKDATQTSIEPSNTPGLQSSTASVRSAYPVSALPDEDPDATTGKSHVD
ncbi:unnamed protein product [Dibothriocephalus latus]|uniref:Uncharacterized protein n=1 Tax=Dibothriocephalus latus TaxID=60516 RepID=A0A3P6V2K2_DIBLA|nr:unnamed protein product [Dibothriocephalus latus]